jgi:hypothetical protein
MFKFKVMPDGGDTFEVEAGMRDLRMWEKTHRGRTFGMLTDRNNMSATALFEVAFVAAKRLGKLPAGVTEDQFALEYEIDLLTSDDDEDGEPDFIQPEA